MVFANIIEKNPLAETTNPFSDILHQMGNIALVSYACLMRSVKVVPSQERVSPL